MRNLFFAEMATVVEQVEAQRGVETLEAFAICEAVLNNVTGGAMFVPPCKVRDVVSEVRKRLGLSEDKGGAR